MAQAFNVLAMMEHIDLGGIIELPPSPHVDLMSDEEHVPHIDLGTVVNLELKGRAKFEQRSWEVAEHARNTRTNNLH